MGLHGPPQPNTPPHLFLVTCHFVRLSSVRPYYVRTIKPGFPPYLECDPEQGYKAAKINVFSCVRPHMVRLWWLLRA